MDRTPSLAEESATDRKTSRIQDLLAIIHDHNKNPPQGRAMGFPSPRSKTTTILDVKEIDEWNGLIEAGLAFDRFHSFVHFHDCVKIGPLYISWHKLIGRAFRNIFGVSQSHAWLCVSILLNQSEEKHDIRQCEVALKGFIKWFASTATKHKICYVSSHQSWESLPWPFLFDWDVVLDTIEYEYDEKNGIGTSMLRWISKHCREIMIDCNGGIPTESDFHALLMNETSKIKHMKVADYTENARLAKSLSATLQQSSTIKSLSIVFANRSRHETVELVEAACACTSLRKISIESGCSVSMDEWMHDIVSLVKCNHFEDVSYSSEVDWENEFNSLSENERKRLRLDRTQTILDVIQENKRILKLDLHPWIDVKPDYDRISSILGRRRDGIIIRKMSRILEVDGPIKMAMFGELITRLCTFSCSLHCVKQNRKILRTTLFSVLCETNEHVVRWVHSGCLQKKRTRSNFEADGAPE